MFLGASEHGLERLAHARRVRCELELVQSEVRIAHARDLLGRVVRINFELIAVGVEKINAPRNSMINSEADRHVVLLQLTIGVAQIVQAFKAECKMSKSYRACVGLAGALSDFRQGDL